MAKTETKERPVAETANVPAVQAGRSVVAASALEKMQGAKHKDTFKAGELMLPWLRIVQTISGYMKRNNEEYISEAREGDIIDTLTKRLRASQTVILVKYETHYTTWKPGGGKLVKQWFADPTGYDAGTFPDGKNFGKKLDGEGNEIAPTPTYYILQVDPTSGSADPATMAWGSTQAKKTRRLNTLARADLVGADGLPFTPPIYSRLFDLTTRGESGDDGKSWAGWVAEPGNLVLAHEKFGDMWYAKAEAFREQIELGNVRPAPPVEADDANDAEERGRRVARPMGNAEAAGDPGRTLDEDIPF